MASRTASIVTRQVITKFDYLQSFDFFVPVESYADSLNKRGIEYLVIISGSNCISEITK